MEKRIYFIYSDNMDNDNLLIKKIHHSLPTQVDIVEAKILGNSLLDSNGKIINGLPGFLMRKEKPICLTETAYKSLSQINNKNFFSPHFPSEQEKEHTETRELFFKMHREKRLKIGEKSIRGVIEQLKTDPYSWPP